MILLPNLLIAADLVSNVPRTVCVRARALVGHRKVFVLLQRLDPKSPTCLEPLRPRTLRSIAREPHGP